MLAAQIICRTRKLKILHPLVQFSSISFFKPFSSSSHKLSSPSFSKDDTTKAFTISYLINSCGLSPNDAVSTSKKVKLKSPENPDAVLKALSKYGFTITNANHIPKLVKKWPAILLASPENSLYPKFKFFCSLGVPVSVLADTIPIYPAILRRSLDNYLVPIYNYLKDVVKTDQNIVTLFKHSPTAFARGSERLIPANIAVLRARGLPELSIVKLVIYFPSLILYVGTSKLADFVDRAEEMGFDKEKFVFAVAIRTFSCLSESTLKRKLDVFRKFGWSESNINAAFLRNPLCMTNSEKKIVDTIDFFVNEVRFKPDVVAQRPVLLGLSLERRLRPRWLIVEILNSKKLLEKKTINFVTLFKLSEVMFLKNYVMRYQQDIPQLLDFYRGKLSYHDLVVSTADEEGNI